MSETSSVHGSKAGSVISSRSSQRETRRDWAVRRAAIKAEEEMEDELRRLELEEQERRLEQLRGEQEKRKFQRKKERLILVAMEKAAE